MRGLLLGGVEELCEYRAICGKICGCTEETGQLLLRPGLPCGADSLKSSVSLSFLGNSPALTVKVAQRKKSMLV